MVKLIQKTWTIVILLFLPACIFFSIPILEGKQGVKLWGKELKNSGFIAVSLLFVSLTLSPLVKLFPKNTFLKALNRHKRVIGLSLFLYVCFHFFAFLFKTYLKKGSIHFSFFLRPIVLPGLYAFILMIPLALTSSDHMIQKMGWQKWKGLHKLIYFSEGFIFLHMALQGGKIFLWAFVFFLPLFFLQLMRINK